jgi:hypothetical protein
MSLHAELSTLHWVAVGVAAFGLVLGGRIVAIVYWEGADVAELAADGEPVVTEPGFTWVWAQQPWEHFYLFPAPDPVPEAWERAREEAARAYLEHAHP